MKITFTMKTSDCLDYPAREYAKELAIKNKDIISEEYDGNEDYYIANKISEFHRIMEKWFEYGESVTLEVDTELNTCTVVEN